MKNAFSRAMKVFKKYHISMAGSGKVLKIFSIALLLLTRNQIKCRQKK
jgi:hypothetical protein